MKESDGRQSRALGLLLTYFLLSNAGSYLMSILSTSLLVKRAGAEYLPVAYLAQNFCFLPVLFFTLFSAPRSSTRLVRFALVGYLGALLLVLPVVGSEEVEVLCLLYVLVRVGKLVLTTFAVGMVAELLPLRVAKTMGPKILAASAGGVVVAGAALKPALATLGMQGTYTATWVTLLLAGLCLLSIPAPGDDDQERGKKKKPKGTPREILRETWAHLTGSPLLRLLGLMQLLMVSNRNLCDFIYAHALGAHFPVEEEMAAFAGTFEASLMLVAIFLQLGLSGYLMRSFKVGTIVRGYPSAISLACLGVLVLGTFPAYMSITLMAALGWETMGKPVRQVLVAGVPGDARTRVVVVMALMGATGSFLSSIALLPAAKLGGPAVPVCLLLGSATLYFLVAGRVERSYYDSLEGILDAHESGEDEPLASLRLSEAEFRTTLVAEMLGSEKPELRMRAAAEARSLGALEALELVRRRLGIEGEADVRAALIASLIGYRHDQLAEDLLPFTEDPDARVRANALEGLGRCTGDPRVRPLLRARRDCEAVRERAAVVLAMLSCADDEEQVEEAVEGLEALLDAPDSPEIRAAGAAVLGRLGHAFFARDLEVLLADPEPQVRRSAAAAMGSLSGAAGLGALQLALGEEEDPEVRAAIEESLEHLQDDTVSSIVEAVDGLSEAERARVFSSLEGSGEGSRLALVSAAVKAPGIESRAELITSLMAIRDPELLEAIGEGLRPATEEGGVELGPLLAFLRPRGPEAASGGYRVLGLLGAAGDPEAARDHVEAVVGELREAPEGDEPGLEHLLATAAALTPEPDRALRSMQAALGEDRHRASVSLEILEKLLPGELGKILLPFLEELTEKRKTK